MVSDTVVSKSKPLSSSSSHKGSSSLLSKTSGSSLREKKVLNVSSSTNLKATTTTPTTPTPPTINTTTTTTSRIPNSSSSSKISALNSPKSHIYKNFTDSSGKSKINNNMMKLDSSEERINRVYVNHSGHQSPLMSRKNNGSNSSINMNKNSINKMRNEYYARQGNTSSPPVPSRSTSFKNLASVPTTTHGKNINNNNNKNSNRNHNINANDEDEDEDEDDYEDYDDYGDDDDDSNDNTFMNNLMNSSLTASLSSTDNNIMSAFDMNNLKEEVNNTVRENTDSSTTVENSIKSSSKKSLKEKLLAKKMKKALKKEEANANTPVEYTINQLLKKQFPCTIDYENESYLKNCSDIVGLINLGNTCFMNSMLQCIFSTIPLCGYFISSKFKKDINSKSSMKGQFVLAFNDLLCEALKNTKNKHIKPSNFKKQLEKFAPQFYGYEQQDSQEFLRFLLDGFHEDLNRAHTKPKFNYTDDELDALSDDKKALVSWNRYQLWNNSYIFDIFGGQLQSRVTCLRCNHQSSTFDTFWDLSLPIPKNTGKRQHTLEDCLREFSAEEQLDDEYKCERCKSAQKASKCLKIYKCPEILVLHLKRFSYNVYIRKKIEDEVEFPTENLVLDPIMSDVKGHDEHVIYDLYGISNHIGGLGSGHYVAHCKSFKDNEWYLKNDDYVKKTSPEDGKDSTAYVLFYRRRH